MAYDDSYMRATGLKLPLPVMTATEINRRWEEFFMAVNCGDNCCPYCRGGQELDLKTKAGGFPPLLKEEHMAREDKTQDDDRTKAYGDYVEMSNVIQQFKRTFAESPNWRSMPPYQKEAFDLIATKMGRLLCGDCYDQDTWYDIIGYAKLAHDEVEKELDNA